MRSFALVLLVLLATTPALWAEEVAKFRVFRDGRITVDGTAIKLDAVPARLQKLKKSDGVVWYYREAGREEPHPNASKLVKAIIEARLPISMSSKADFSTVVLPDGSVKSRRPDKP